jgi:polar amino acid transport system permease protein
MIIWDWAFAWRILPDLLEGVWITALVTFASAALALAGGLALAVFSLTTGRIGSLAARAVLEFLRGVPILVLLYIGFYALPQYGLTLPAFVIGVVVLGVVYGAFCSEVYRGALIVIPQGLRDAALALGLSAWVTWTRILIPLAVRSSLPSLINYVLVLYRQSALLFAIGVPVLLARAQIVGYQSFRYLEPYTIAGVMYLLLNLPLIYLLARLQARHAASAA